VLFLFDVFLHELGDDLVFMNELGLALLDLALFGALKVDGAARPNLQSLLGLVENLPDPVVNLAGLGAELFGKVRDGFLVAEVPADDLRFLCWREVLMSLTHGNRLRLVHDNPTGSAFQFREKQYNPHAVSKLRSLGLDSKP
jgi:hypothetical protein